VYEFVRIEHCQYLQNPHPTLTFLSVMFLKLKRFVQSTIGLSGSEANAFMLLIPLLFIVIFSEPFYRWSVGDSTPLSFRETVFLDSLTTTVGLADANENADSISRADPPPFLTAFDPNKASLDELKSLGIPEKISGRIVQYRSKGGSFRIKSDLAKMYGMDSVLYRKLYSFISLPDKLEKREFMSKGKPLIVVQYDLNLADTSALQGVKGIGRVLAKRIVKYRDGLGGFVRLSQLREVFGLDSLVINEFNKFYVSDSFVPRKIEINKATEKELDAHPYISSRDAKSIITYRIQHGNYLSSDELLKIKTLTESTVTKIDPYLSFE
jgi:competence protein ComEA